MKPAHKRGKVKEATVEAFFILVLSAFSADKKQGILSGVGQQHIIIFLNGSDE
jgi:hypothetical protein